MPAACTARVPAVVTGDPDTVKMLGTVSATEVTVPVPVIAAQLVEDPFVVKNLPAFPVCVGAKALNVAVVV